MKIVLISGKAEAGKTTAANFLKRLLQRTYGKNVAIVPYAAYLKSTAKTIWEWNGKKDEGGRHLLQWWGTEVVREKDPDFWVKAVMNVSDMAEPYLDYLIIDDCRFPNEINMWKKTCFVENSGDELDDHLVLKRRWPNIFTIRIERPGHENALTEEQRKHPSETALDDYKFDITISAQDSWDLMDRLNSAVIPNIVDISTAIQPLV